MDFKGHNRDNIPFYSSEWGVGLLVWELVASTIKLLPIWRRYEFGLQSYRKGKDVELITSRYFILLIPADLLQ